MVTQPSIRSQQRYPRLRRILKIGFLLLIGLVTTTLIIILAAALTLHLRFLAVSPGIEKAIRATYPSFCARSDQKIIIEHALLSANLDLWDVRCEPSGIPWKESFVTVNVASCEVNRPAFSSVDWETIYGEMVRRNPLNPKLASCP